MANKPRIRFKGFTEDWEQREFSDIFAEVKSGLSRMLSNDDIGVPVVRANNINDGQLNLVDDIKYWYKNDPQGANTNNYLIEQGDILINFINSEAKMGTAAYVTRRPERDTIYTTNILRCKVNDEYNPYFIYSLTFLNSYKNYIASITKPAVNQASFTTVDFKKYSIKIPTIKEQNQIADLIEIFNKFITLHQCKLEKLKLTKKALLQKLFPKNGTYIPEIRFKGFTDAWEQCKFGELFEYERPDAYIVKSDNYNDVFNMPVLTANKAFILGYTNEENSYNKPSIIFDDFTLDKKYVDFPYMLKSSAIKILTSKNQHNLRFLFERLNSTRFEVLGHARHYISVVQNTSTLCPSIEEEFCISNLLTRFDEIITLHQRKLERLQEVKKGLLQKMFV